MVRPVRPAAAEPRVCFAGGHLLAQPGEVTGTADALQWLGWVSRLLGGQRAGGPRGQDHGRDGGRRGRGLPRARS